MRNDIFVVCSLPLVYVLVLDVSGCFNISISIFACVAWWRNDG